MLTLEILSPERLDDDKKALTSLIEEAGIVTRFVTPSSMSFLTSMRIASECKKAVPDSVICHRLKDVIGAISARELTRKRGGDFRILYFVSPDDETPKRMPTEIMKAVDCWVFPDEETAARYSAIEDLVMNSSALLYPTTTEGPLKEKTPSKTDSINILYLGPLEKLKSLSDAIDTMVSLDNNNRLTMTVLTTGSARFVMPLVRRARANNLSIDWKGNEYNLEKELARADAILVANPPHLSPREIRALLAGHILVSDSRELEAVNEGKTDEIISRMELLRSYHNPEQYVETLKRIIKP